MSLNCPACERPAKCTDSRRRKNNMVKRRYDCPHCGLRFQTFEAIVAVLEKGPNKRLEEHSTKGMDRTRVVLESAHIHVI